MRILCSELYPNWMKFSEERNSTYVLKQSITLTPPIFRKQIIAQQRHSKITCSVFYPAGPDVCKARADIVTVTEAIFRNLMLARQLFVRIYAPNFMKMRQALLSLTAGHTKAEEATNERMKGRTDVWTDGQPERRKTDGQAQGQTKGRGVHTRFCIFTS